MNQRQLSKESVIITAHQQKLLQEPDPAIANKSGLFRVPIGEGQIDYSAADWTNAWRAGSIDFVDSYYLAHGKQPSKEIVDKLQTYIYVNKLDPMFPSSWTVAHERLQAAGVIKLEFAELPPEPREPRAAKRKDITQLSDKDAKQRLVEDADAVMAESVRPVWKEFISLLKSNQKSLSVDEQRYLLTLVEQVGSSPNPLGRTQPVTVELLMRSLQKIRPDYLTVEWARELQKIDDLENMKADDWRRKYAVPKAGPRAAFATSRAYQI